MGLPQRSIFVTECMENFVDYYNAMEKGRVSFFLAFATFILLSLVSILDKIPSSKVFLRFVC
jgi:hypothetical protein